MAQNISQLWGEGWLLSIVTRDLTGWLLHGGPCLRLLKRSRFASANFLRYLRRTFFLTFTIDQLFYFQNAFSAINLLTRESQFFYSLIFTYRGRTELIGSLSRQLYVEHSILSCCCPYSDSLHSIEVNKDWTVMNIFIKNVMKLLSNNKMCC